MISNEEKAGLYKLLLNSFENILMPELKRLANESVSKANGIVPSEITAKLVLSKYFEWREEQLWERGGSELLKQFDRERADQSIIDNVIGPLAKDSDYKIGALDERIVSELGLMYKQPGHMSIVDMDEFQWFATAEKNSYIILGRMFGHLNRAGTKGRSEAEEVFEDNAEGASEAASKICNRLLDQAQMLHLNLSAAVLLAFVKEMWLWAKEDEYTFLKAAAISNILATALLKLQNMLQTSDYIGAKKKLGAELYHIVLDYKSAA